MGLEVGPSPVTTRGHLDTEAHVVKTQRKGAVLQASREASVLPASCSLASGHQTVTKQVLTV